MEIENTPLLEEEDIFMDSEDVKEKTFTDTENTEVLEEEVDENGVDPVMRDFSEEIRELWRIRPQLRGQKLPDEVAKAAANGRNLSVAYLEHEAEQARKQAASSRKENEILRQNAASAARAPVKGTTGSSVDQGPKDPFLEGFEKSW